MSFYIIYFNRIQIYFKKITINNNYYNHFLNCKITCHFKDILFKLTKIQSIKKTLSL